MNVTQKGILTLLRSAITGETLPLPEGFEIEDAYSQIKRHHMAALVYEGAVHCGVSGQNPVMQRLFQGYAKSLQISERQMAQISRICSVFEENGIDYMPLKGCNMKPRYPKPELRNMGDADILIRLEQYDRIVPLMESLGFREAQDTSHELVWKSEALYLELHKRLVPSINKDFNAYFGDGWRLAKRKNGTRYSMTPEDELVYLFTHFAKHYRDGGIGCRHVVDLWVYLRKNPDLDESYVERELAKLKLLEFYQNICRLIRVWFEDAPTDEKIALMTQFLFSSGSWGEEESKALSRMLRDSKHSVLGFNGKFLYIFQTLFPGVEVLREKYTILKKAPYLLPLVWVYRLIWKLLFQRDSLKIHEKNLDTINRQNLENRHQMLNYVGLDYNF